MNQHLLNTLTNSYLFWIALIYGLLTLYILPSLIAAVRRAEGLGWIIVINLLSSGVGWPAALLLAITQPTRYPAPAPAPGPVWPPAQRPEHHRPSAFPASPAVPAGTTVISGARYSVIQARSTKTPPARGAAHEPPARQSRGDR
jgi:hypothetical protein